jgi:hypothetical protein
LTSSSTWSARNDVNIAVETDIHELWFGPRLALQPTDWLALNITPRLSLNYVSTGVQRSETFLAVHADGSVESLDSWHDHAGKAKLMLGAGVTAGVDINIGGGFFAGIWGGYERVSGDFNINVGPNAVSLDLTGYTAGAAVGFCFGGGVRPATTSALGDLLEGVDVEAPVKSVLATARGGVNTAVSATAEVARVPASPPSSDAPGKPQVEVVSLGEDVYKKLDHLLNTSNDPEMVRRVIGYIKKNEPTMYAALTKYVEQKKSLSTQTAGRAAANMAAIPTEAVKAPRSVAEPQLSVAGVQSGTVRGECVYRKLDNLLKTGNAADMVRRAIETVKQHQPDDYAALLAYVEQKKIERLQLAKR